MMNDLTPCFLRQAPESGVMQMLPRTQHAQAAFFKTFLTPVEGGYAIWGRQHDAN